MDEVWETLLCVNSNITRSSIYRTFCRNEINRVPQKESGKAKKFKEYEPGFKSKKGKLCEKPSKLDIICKENNIDHRLTKPNTPKTNGMVERVNGTIKNGTILKEIYTNKEEMNNALMAFLVHYMLYKRHGGLRRELNVKTPYQAVEKWFELKPGIFKENPLLFKKKILFFINNNSSLHKQPCET